MKKALIFVHDIYEELELHYPRLRLLEAGWQVYMVGEKEGATYHGKYGYPCKADKSFAQINSEEFDGLIIPGGYAPDKIRKIPEALKIVAQMHESKKKIGFICHGGWVPISAKILDGKKVTGTLAIKDDLENAKAIFLDQEVVIDQNLISSRTPVDLPAFMQSFLQ